MGEASSVGSQERGKEGAGKGHETEPPFLGVDELPSHGFPWGTGAGVTRDWEVLSLVFNLQEKLSFLFDIIQDKRGLDHLNAFNLGQLVVHELGIGFDVFGHYL